MCRKYLFLSATQEVRPRTLRQVSQSILGRLYYISNNFPEYICDSSTLTTSFPFETPDSLSPSINPEVDVSQTAGA